MGYIMPIAANRQPESRATVVIVNWNGRALLSDTLHALRLQTEPAFHTMIVDNGSHDGSVDYIKRHFPYIDILPLGWNAGFAHANNVAIENVGTPYTLLLNNDAVPSRNWISSLIAALDENPLAGMAASKMLYFDDPGLIDRVGDAYTTAGAGKLRGRKESARRYNNVEWIFGACAGAAIYRTEALREVGCFDKDFFLINEDVDLSFRLQSRGYRCLFVPEAVVYHKASSTIGHDSETSVYYGHRNLEWVFIKNLPLSLLIKMLPMHVIYNLAAMAFFFARGHARTYLKAKRDALAGSLKMLKKRRIIQATRRVDTAYLSSLITPENLISRKHIRRQAPEINA